MKWTPEQDAIADAAANESCNMLIEALAGAAKTTTLVRLASLLKGSVLSVAFNKKIADEMSQKMPKNVEFRTLNSLGHRIWGQKLGRRLNLYDKKMNALLREYIEEHTQSEQEELYDVYGDILKLAQDAKSSGHVPDSRALPLGKKCTPLVDDATLFELASEDLSGFARGVVIHILEKSWDRAMDGNIDYNDQLLMPTVMQCPFPSYDNVLVDEAQDLSELNHKMLEKLAKRRIIACGDSKQAIYAFRGAHSGGMSILANRFKMETLHLSTSFRCPENVCNHVRNHVPRIEHWVDNPRNPGKVQFLTEWDFDLIKDGDVIICRNNAPLVSMAIKMLRAGRKPNVWGRDIAAAIVKVMEKFGPPNMQRADALLALTRYDEERRKQLKKEGAIAAHEDRMDCIRVFLEDAESLAGAIHFANSVLTSPGQVDLCTGHKSKGNEWENVFFLDHALVGDEDQEANLRYVISTRALGNLTYIDLDGYAPH